MAAALFVLTVGASAGIWLLERALVATPANSAGGTLGQILVFFTKAGSFVFGSGLAIVPFLQQGVVHDLGWLNEQQFLDAVAVALITPQGKLRTRIAVTRVSLLRLSEKQIADYVESREGVGKAGGYAIQGVGSVFVTQLTGSYSNVVGLPLFETAQLLRGRGWEGL